MRWREIIGEDRRPLNKSLKYAAPNLSTIDYLDNNSHPYLAYRFGVALAASPDNRGYAEGPIGSRFTMVDYTEGDAEIRRGAERKMGVKSSRGTGKVSAELPSINTQSPIKPKGPVRPKK